MPDWLGSSVGSLATLLAWGTVVLEANSWIRSNKDRPKAREIRKLKVDDEFGKTFVNAPQDSNIIAKTVDGFILRRDRNPRHMLSNLIKVPLPESI
jgi:hypothetical protein